VITGRLVSPAEPLARELGVDGRLRLVGRYAQEDAPDLMRGAHVLLHTQMNDSCPSLVLEAMACGVPVVHLASGGTVELVADVAGVGVPHEASWERLEPPAAEELATAVSRVLSELERFRDAARRRAVERYALGPWLDRHAALFGELLDAR
jgi:glycosyltransferase involved in cell wall biosynthesis